TRVRFLTVARRDPRINGRSCTSRGVRSYGHHVGQNLRTSAGRKVGELATATGLTIRTLHYYEEIGLLVASGRTEAGHRLYSDADVERLYRISLLVYADLEAAFEYLVRVFGLGPGELTRDADGRVVHGELQAGDGVVWLHPESAQWRMASPRSLGAVTASVAVMVDDVDAHFRHAQEEGAEIVYEPVDQPYGYREYDAVDVEGHLWSFMKPLD